jgi:hypothetical protein
MRRSIVQTASCKKEQRLHRSIVSFAIVVLSAGWLIARPAAAQNQLATPGVPDAVAPNASVSDQRLDQAAAAMKNMRTVRNNYVQKFDAASPDEKDKIISEANVAFEKVVIDQGLSLDEFDSIMTLAENDPIVRERIEKRLGGVGK